MKMRTQQEILDRIEEVKASDFFGATRGDLIEALEFENAKPFLKEGVTAGEWTWNDAQGVRKAAIEYMEFAWGKANDCRGLSASRSVDHYRAWMWLLGSDEFEKLADDEYEFYGQPVLVIAATALGVDWRALDNGWWTNSEDEDDGGIPDTDEVNRLEEIGKRIAMDIATPQPNPAVQGCQR